MLSHNPFSHKAAEPSGIAVSFFQGVENLRPFLDCLRVQLIFLIDSGVDIPAIITEADMITRERHIH